MSLAEEETLRARYTLYDGSNLLTRSPEVNEMAEGLSPKGNRAQDRPSMESSMVLLQRARAGDGSALNILFERYMPRLRRWATGRLPRWRSDLLDTDDLIQETVLQTLKRVDEFEPRREGAFLAYLRQGVLNRIRDEARRAARRPRSDEGSEELVDPGASPLEEAIGREQLDRYESAMNRLKSEDREAIVARIEMGCTYEQVAEALDKPSTDAARMAVSRALLRLAKEISHDK